jgi:hypothetical protein
MLLLSDTVKGKMAMGRLHGVIPGWSGQAEFQGDSFAKDWPRKSDNISSCIVKSSSLCVSMLSRVSEFWSFCFH